MSLDPIARKLIEETKASGRPNAHLLPVEVARENFENTFASLKKPKVDTVREVKIPVRDGQEIRGRLYFPSGGETSGIIVYFHGGGWLLGSIDSHDVTTRKLANAAGFPVLSVDYRRGPDYRFPTAVEDALAAFDWVIASGTELGIDTSNIAVAGDSAGGNLAAAVSNARKAQQPHIAHQLLVYPVTTWDLHRGFDEKYEGIMLYRDELQWHQDNYLASSADKTDVRINVLEDDLEGAPPATILLAECDPIRPQGELYAQALQAADVPVEVHQTPGLVHGFFGLDEVFPTADEAMQQAGRKLRDALLGKP